MKSKMVTLDPQVGSLVQFYVNAPVQNVGSTGEARTGVVVKVNSSTFVVVDEAGTEHRVGRQWSNRATYLPKILKK